MLKKLHNICSSISIELLRDNFRLINATERFAENAPLKNGVFSRVAKNMKIQAQAITQESLVQDITFVENSSQQNSSSFNQPEITISVKALQRAKQQLPLRQSCNYHLPKQQAFPSIY